MISKNIEEHVGRLASSRSDKARKNEEKGNPFHD
jgi:hypothetical protein